MGETTGIAWCDHTFNPWIGCTKVSPGCENCYAERQNKFYNWNPSGWGKGKSRKLTSDENWKKPIRWAKQAVKDGVTRRVFCASLADVFDDEAPFGWLNRLWQLVFDTQEIGGLEWLVLTKRPENIITRIPTQLSYADSSVRIGITIENQEMADKRILEFLRAWNGKNFVSVEPMLSEVHIEPWLKESPEDTSEFGIGPLQTINWVICGCESGTGARPMNPDWARSLRDQCVGAGVPFFLKQMMIDGKLVKMPELDGRVWNQFRGVSKA